MRDKHCRREPREGGGGGTTRATTAFVQKLESSDADVSA